MAGIKYVSATGNADIDGLLSGVAWTGTVTYSFPDSANDYSSGYGYGEPRASGFGSISSKQKAVVHTIMDQVKAYTNLDLQYAGTNGADIKIAQSSEANPTAYAYYPGNYEEGGDIWFGTNYNFRSPTPGTYQYHAHLHEIGHALGLKHAHDESGPGSTHVPDHHDSLEYSVMTYHSFVGSTASGYTNETYGYPTTFMMNDIIALQEMYGADFTTESSNTVYTWNPSTGETYINGVGQGRPGGSGAPSSANNIFMTIWDGGGIDTYDFSNYTSNLNVDLRPGEHSITKSAQLAYLGYGEYARGNVFNAYVYKGDTRSLIENAKGGTGNDVLKGNSADNRLDGGRGADRLTGYRGDDTFVYWKNYGLDTITDFGATGDADQIELFGFDLFADFDDIWAVSAQIGVDTVITFSVTDVLKLRNFDLTSLDESDFVFRANMAPTGISLSGGRVAENQDGAVIGDLIVSDPGGDTTFGFTVTDARFEVRGSAGNYELALKSGVSLDYESATSVSFDVTATDTGGLSVTETVNVTVLDRAGVKIRGTKKGDIITDTQTAPRQNTVTDEGDRISTRAGDDVVRAGGGNDFVNGGAHNDALYGESGHDSLNGSKGNDRLYGGEGRDYLNGSKGNDWLYGDEGRDNLNGSKGNDRLYGGDGNDTLIGSKGLDWLLGGDGNDYLIGGKHDDRFVFGADFGHDTIRDFRAGSRSSEVIQMSSSYFSSLAEVLAASTQVGSDLLITADGSNSLLLLNVSAGQLTADDFFFV